MALTVFPLWSQQWTDANGVPLAGGLVYSFNTGTDTPAESLFHDVEGSSAWANPIELGSDGRFTDMVFQTATPSIDISVNDADDVPVGNLQGLGPIQAYAGATEPEPPCSPPVIIAQPQSQNLDAGDSATVFVVVTGTAPIAFQWYLGTSGTTSDPINGAVASVYTSLPLAAGTYAGWVRCANACGTADSNTVALVVT